MQVRHFYTPGLAINSYLVFDDITRKGALIDPTRQVEVYLSKAMQEHVEITDILETHVHADFVSGAPEIKAALQGKPVIHCSGMGGDEWVPKYADKVVRDHDQVSLGNVFLEAIHTPGHTPEHIIWLCYDESRSITSPSLLFSGDLLFVGSIGRPDLLGAHIEEILAKQLYRSLFSVLHALPDYLQVYPAHGAESLCGKGISKRETTTLGYEKRCNPWLLPQTYARWHELLLKEMPSAPKYFKVMKEVNVTGLHSNWGDEMPPVINQEVFDSLQKTCAIVDVRSPSSFAERHIKGAINIPFAQHFITWAGSVLSRDKDIVLFIDHVGEAWAVVQSLRLIGFDHIRGVCALDHWHWDLQSDETESLPTISVEMLKNDLKHYHVVDVRTIGEWNAGHIEGAHHIELTNLTQSLEKIPKGTPLAVICKSGTRASIAASFLAREPGYEPFNVKGGMIAWDRCNEGN